MAAGAGVRFGIHTQTKPKGFVCVGGTPMIVSSIEKMLHVGIEKIIIGVGYQYAYYEELARKYPQIVYCISDKYAETNSMYTLYCCNDLIGNDDFLLFESDLIYERKALPVLINSDYPDATLVTPFTKVQDGYYLFADDEGFLSDCTTDVSKREPSKGELVGIHKISNRLYKKMHGWYGNIWQQRPMLGYEYALVEMSRLTEKIYLLKEDHLFWYEIDDEADLLYAEKEIMPHID